MPFPASSTTPAKAWDEMTARARRIKERVQKDRAASLAGATGRSGYLQLQRQLDDAVEFWDSLSGTPGLQAYVRDNVANAGAIDLVAEYTTMRTAALVLRDWIFNNLPRDSGSGATLIWSHDEAGDPVELTVSSAAAAGFRTQADIFTATID